MNGRLIVLVALAAVAICGGGIGVGWWYAKRDVNIQSRQPGQAFRGSVLLDADAESGPSVAGAADSSSFVEQWRNICQSDKPEEAQVASLFAAWGAVDWNEAWKHSFALQTPKLRETAQINLMLSFKQNAQKLIEILNSDKELPIQSIVAILNQLSREGVALSFDTLEALDRSIIKEAKTRDDLEGMQIALSRSTVIKWMANVDPNRAFQTAAALESERRASLLMVVANASAQDLPGLLGELERLPEGALRDRIVREIAARTNETSEKEPRWAGLLSKGGELEHSADAISRAASIDPFDAAATRVLELPPGGSRARALETVVGEMAQTDPRAALNWVNDLPGQAERYAAFSTLAATLGKEEAVATELLNDSQDPYFRQALITAIAQQMGETSSMDEILTRADQFEAEDREQFAAVAKQRFALLHPEKFRGYVANSFQGTGDLQGLEVLSHVDPYVASEIYLKRQGELDVDMFDMVLSGLARQNASAAEEWLERIESGERRDRGLVEVVRWSSLTSPASAAETVRKIGDPQQRKVAEELIEAQSQNPSVPADAH